MDFTWVTTDDANAIQNSIVDAKGDIVAASANDTPARLAVGNNGETLVADSSTSTGLRWQSPKSVNGIINSNYSIWQRGTSNVTTYLAYTADRWQKGGGTHFGISRTTVSDTTNLPFIQYAARMQRTSGSATTTLMDFGYSMETADAIKYAGQTVTMSFYARKGANYSGAAGASFGFALYTGTGTDQSVMSGYTGSAATINTAATLTTTMARYQATVTIPTTATELALYFSYTPTGTAGANDYVDITGVQLEIGSIATPYTPYSGTIQGELSAAQRYYTRESVTNGYSYLRGFGNATTTSLARIIVPFPVEMRVKPTAMDFGGALAVSDGGTFYSTGSFVLSTNSTTENAQVEYTHGTASFIQYRYYGLQDAAAATAYIGFSAEL
jgi:hypothetical protein